MKRVGNESDELAAKLLSKIRQYRLEALTDFYTDPTLLLGDGLRSFELLSLFVPTLQVGPTGYPLPGGSFSDSNGTPKFPVDTHGGIDVFKGFDERIRNQDDCTPGGNNVKSNSTNGNWHAFEVEADLAAGNLGATDLVAAVANWLFEINIYDIIVFPVDHADPVDMIFAWSASGGAITGQVEDTHLVYRNDDTNDIYAYRPVLHFQNGKRFIGDTLSESLQFGVAGGKGVEKITILGNYRLF